MQCMKFWRGRDLATCTQLSLSRAVVYFRSMQSAAGKTCHADMGGRPREASTCEHYILMAAYGPSIVISIGLSVKKPYTFCVILNELYSDIGVGCCRSLAAKGPLQTPQHRIPNNPSPLAQHLIPLLIIYT